MLTLSRRAAVASALGAAGARGLSGEALAAELGISRTAVTHHVAALRALGYDIVSAPRIGHRLVAAPDVCIPEEIAPRLCDALWTSCEGALELGSTSDEAKRLARAGAAEGTVVVAARQSTGRGRFGRVWESPEGGAYASFVLRPGLSPAHIAPLSLVVALGAARALRALGVPASLKWPNDLESPEGKLGGILLEMAAEADSVEWVVAGIGINVDRGAHGRAAAVRDSVPDARVADVAAAVLDGIASAYRAYTAEGFAPLRAEYECLLTMVGTPVVVRDAAGEVVADGRVLGVGDDGALVLATTSGEIRITAGEVTLRA